MPDAGLVPDTQELVVRHGADLVAIAAGSIRRALADPGWRPAAPAAVAAALAAPGASFVTLRRDGGLRGCIGSVAAERALADDVARNAWAAAFADPRFDPLTASEAPDLAIEVSVLTAPQPFAVADEADLLARLRPGVDGLILADRGRRAVFLPAVWDVLPQAQDFVAHLKAKAGLARDHWSASVTVARFEAFKAIGTA
ncbi:MAG: AmmeMemoRadiSam system protein A [Rhodospirillales bacterium]